MRLATPDTASTASWLSLTARVEHPRLRLICFPYAGGGGQAFRDWTATLPPGIELWAAVLPGRGARVREAPLDRLEPIVAGAATALEPLLDRPVALFGHSFGALVAFELTRELARRRLPGPVQLFVSAARAPHRPPGEALSALPEDAFLERIRRLNGTPSEVLDDGPLMRLVAPALRADFAAAEGYVCTAEPPLSVPITAFGGTRDPHVSADDLDGWGWYTRGRFAVRTFDGDHFFMHSAAREVPAAIATEPAVREVLS